MTTPSRAARATAHANIALAKYWGKVDGPGNLPAVPSLSITLEALKTTTEVRFVEGLGADELVLNGQAQGDKALERVRKLLDEVRTNAELTLKARVRSENNFPTASGLASSASAFAALSAAATRAAGVPVELGQVSNLARRASASAGRSVFGGFVRLPAGTPGQEYLAAEPVAPANYWDLRVVIAVATEGPKSIGSTQGMQHTKLTSPYYEPWLRLCPSLVKKIEDAIATRDLDALGAAAEHSALSMHACAMGASPGLLYFQPVTIACIHAVRELRAKGETAYITIDAGPHVKVITTPEGQSRVREALASVPGVLRTIESGLGGDVEIADLEG